MVHPRILLLSVALVVATGIIWEIVSSRGAAETPADTDAVIRDQPTNLVFPVRVAVARSGELVRRIPTSGVLRAGRQLEMHSVIGGMLLAVPAFNGKSVCKDECLVRMDDREQRAACDRATADLLRAQIEFRSLSATPFLPSSDSAESGRQVAQESRRLDSLTRAYQEGRLDRVPYERLRRESLAVLAYLSAPRGDVIAGRCGLPQANEAYQNAQRALESTTIRAPFAGVVADCDLVPGMRVATGQVLLTVSDLRYFLVDVQILESEAWTVAVGQNARVQIAGLQGHAMEGRVVSMNPRVEPETKTIDLTVRIDSGALVGHGTTVRLWPGMFCSVTIETQSIRNRLIVPRSALLSRDQRALVFAVQNSVAKWCYVTTGASDETSVEILSGLADGDTVIIDGHFTLAHDTRVSVIPDTE